MAQFESAKQDFLQRSLAMVFIAAEKRAGIFKPERYFEKHPISFPFLLDEDRSVTRAWGVYQRLRMDAFNIARPATFVVDRQRHVRWIYLGASQVDRAHIEEVLRQAVAAR
ncbi:MAG: redoxin domain-containing protein [Acidobacteria bacterium]|nr:redoxin domain-containing protein [Acidobacteriota bacterium]